MSERERESERGREIDGVGEREREGHIRTRSLKRWRLTSERG